MADPANPNRLQLLSLTLAYDDTRFFGAVIFTHPNHPEEKNAAVFIDHTDEPPWFRLSNVNPDAQNPAAPEMVETDRIMRFLLRYTQNASAARAPTSRNPDRSAFPTLGGTADDAPGLPAPLQRPHPLGARPPRRHR